MRLKFDALAVNLDKIHLFAFNKFVKQSFIWFIVELRTTPASTEEPRPGAEFCFLENFQASCFPGFQVRITRAELGRMRLGRCVREDEYIGCLDLVTDEVQEKCRGKQSCVFHVSELGRLIQSCPTSRLSYLYVEHECVIRKKISFFALPHHHFTCDVRDFPL